MSNPFEVREYKDQYEFYSFITHSSEPKTINNSINYSIPSQLKRRKIMSIDYNVTVSGLLGTRPLCGRMAAPHPRLIDQ